MRNLARCYFELPPALVSYCFYSLEYWQKLLPQSSLTDWVTGERGALDLLLPSALTQLLPSLTKAGRMWLWYIAVYLPRCTRTWLHSQLPLTQVSAGVHYYKCLCKLGRWSTPAVGYLLCSSGSRSEWVAVLWQPVDNCLVCRFTSWMEQGWH